MSLNARWRETGKWQIQTQTHKTLIFLFPRLPFGMRKKKEKYNAIMYCEFGCCWLAIRLVIYFFFQHRIPPFMCSKCLFCFSLFQTHFIFNFNFQAKKFNGLSYTVYATAREKNVSAKKFSNFLLFSLHMNVINEMNASSKVMSNKKFAEKKWITNELSTFVNYSMDW